MKSRREPVKVLVAEDDPQDAFLLKRAFTRQGIDASVDFVCDGQEAIDYLEGEGSFAGQKKKLPSLLLLDLKMPRLNGFDVLQWLRGHAGLHRMPVVVLSSSALKRDVNRAYELGANSFIVKPGELTELQGLMECFEKYWFDRIEFPECNRG